MKILVVHPGASMSTHDVCVGLTEGLKARGHTIYEYALDGRIERSGAWLNYCWKRLGKETELPRPNSADILYHAGEELVARALRIHQPEAPLDWVLVVSAMYLHPDVLVLLSRARLRVAVLFTESPYDDERQVRLLRMISCGWTNERTSARAMNIGYLAHAHRPQLHNTELPVSDDVAAHDVVFVGTGFHERIEVLEAVDWTGIDFAIYGPWELLGPRHRLRAHLKGGYVTNEQATALYRRAKIGLNLHRTSKGFGKGAPRIQHAESLNPRAYELAASGCFTISDARAELIEVFGDLVPTFETPEQLGELARRWLADEPGRARIRAQLPGKVAAHTWDARAAQIEADLLSMGTVAGSAASDRAAVAVGG